MKVRITNDGKHNYNTHFTSIETGQELLYVTKATITFNASQEAPTADITMLYPEVDIIADAEIKHVCRCCGHPVDEKGKPI